MTLTPNISKLTHNNVIGLWSLSTNTALVSAHYYFNNKTTLTLCFEGVEEDDNGLLGEPVSFLVFFSLTGGESGPFSTLGEAASSFDTSTTRSPSLLSPSLS